MRFITSALLAWGLFLSSSLAQASPLIPFINLAHFNSVIQGNYLVCGNCGHGPRTRYRHVRRYSHHSYAFPPRTYFDYYGPLNPAFRFYGCPCRL
jgi:hypothetical protein